MAFFFGHPSDYHSKVVQDPSIHPKMVQPNVKKEAEDAELTKNQKGVSSDETENTGFDSDAILRFDAQFMEKVPESPDERQRFRHVRIKYFCEDKSFLVHEPRKDNSGLLQGAVFSRQRMPKKEGGFYSLEDLSVPGEVNFYGVQIRILSCGDLTKKILLSQGLKVEEFEEIPKDEYAEKHATVPPQRVHVPKKHKTLDEIGKVLRFYCVWDDKEDVFGEMKKYVIHFFVANDTAEVREVHEANDGQTPFPLFLQRSKLPKVRHTDGHEDEEYIMPEDFVVGESVNVMGREFYLYDCDKSTREYYKKMHGIEQKKLECPKDEEEEEEPEIRLSTAGAVPRFDFKQNSNGKILRFGARLLSKNPVDRDRKFIISFYLDDDSLSIFEPPARNSGVPTGSFLHRQPVALPDQEEGMPQNNYTALHFALGKVINVHHRVFLLDSADECALHFMEIHSDAFPDSDLSLIMEQLIEQIPEQFGEVEEGMTVEDFVKVNFKDLNAQQIMTVQRRFDTVSEFINALKASV